MTTLTTRWTDGAIRARMLAFDAVDASRLPLAQRAAYKLELHRVSAATDAGLLPAVEAAAAFARLADRIAAGRSASAVSSVPTVLAA